MFLNFFLFYQVVRPLGRKSVNKYLYSVTGLTIGGAAVCAGALPGLESYQANLFS